MSKQYSFIEVCAGGGGLSSGLIKAGFKPLLLNDYDKNCCKTLELNHPDTNIIQDSMINLKLDDYIGKVDLLCGGVPCQSFSQAGKRKGLEDSRGKLMLTFCNMIKLLKPTCFMIENVKGLLNHDKGKTIKKIIDLLNSTKLYNVKYELLNSKYYNVPQKRERVFIIGFLKSKSIDFKFPPKNEEIKTLKTVLKNVPKSDGYKYNEKKIKLFKLIKPGECWINLPLELQKEYLGKSFYSKGGKRGILRRLSMDEPCLTLLCSPSQKQTERCHPEEERPLTIREYARIQTFDDDYNFFGSISSRYKQIGNAVPVELARILGLSIYQSLSS